MALRHPVVIPPMRAKKYLICVFMGFCLNDIVPSLAFGHCVRERDGGEIRGLFALANTSRNDTPQALVAS